MAKTRAIFFFFTVVRQKMAFFVSGGFNEKPEHIQDVGNTAAAEFVYSCYILVRVFSTAAQQQYNIVHHHVACMICMHIHGFNTSVQPGTRTIVRAYVLYQSQYESYIA